jgi:CBS domain-containing protein
MEFWSYPNDRYYYEWYDQPDASRASHSDSEIKSTVVDRLRTNPHTADCTLKVDVKRGVVILRGQVPSRRAKRAAGDDAWDTPGVADVSIHLDVVVTGDRGYETPTVRDVMTRDVITANSWDSVERVATLMASNEIGSVVIVTGDEPVGIVTDRDIVVRCATEGSATSDMPISLALTPSPVFVGPSDSVDRAVDTMRAHAIRRLPVVASGMLVGVVSLGDLARVRDPGSALAEISGAAANNDAPPVGRV